jgi:hypothetical protein
MHQLRVPNLGTIGFTLSFFAETNIWLRKKWLKRKISFGKFYEKNDVGKK